jgi:LmbE family N-acetylglucosaminyl deacetylase
VTDDVDPLPPGGPTTVDLATPERALVIVAHPDDAEFQAGGTLAKWARQGCVVHHLVLTDGSKGTWDPHKDPAELVEERREEQRAAAIALGGSGVAFLDWVDGELPVSTVGRGQVASVIRRLRPQVVLGHDPWKRYRLHPDHHAAGRLCVEGIVAARDPGFHRDQLSAGLEPHRPEALLLFEPDVANHAESVSEEDHATRLRALEAFTSQIATTHLYKVDEGVDPMAAWRDRERRRLAGPGAWAGVELAEPFRLIVDQL